MIPVVFSTFCSSPCRFFGSFQKLFNEGVGALFPSLLSRGKSRVFFWYIFRCGKRSFLQRFNTPVIFCQTCFHSFLQRFFSGMPNEFIFRRKVHKPPVFRGLSRRGQTSQHRDSTVSYAASSTTSPLDMSVPWMKFSSTSARAPVKRVLKNFSREETEKEPGM